MATLGDLTSQEFWQVIDTLDQIAPKLGINAPKLRPVLQQMAAIDCDTIERVARTAWGTGGDAGFPTQVATGVPKHLTAALAHADDGWRGPAFTNFQNAMNKLMATAEKLTKPAHDIGKLLEQLAKEMRMTWHELISLVVGLAGAVMAVAGAILAVAGISLALVSGGAAVPLAVAGVIVGVIGAILAEIALIDSLITTGYDRYRAIIHTATALQEEIDHEMPGVPDAGMPTPDPRQWTPKDDRGR